jgi:hypothetical protein
MSSFFKSVSSALSSSSSSEDEKAAQQKLKEDAIQEDEDFEPKFVAGTSVTELGDITDQDKVLAAEQCWSKCPEDSFMLRVGPNYAKTGTKAPSPSSLYDLVGLDFIQSGKRINNIGRKVIFPKEWTDGYETSSDDEGEENLEDSVEFGSGEHLPTIFIVNTQFPSDFSSSMFSEGPTDGAGWSLVQYFRVKKSVMEEAKNMKTASGPVQLFAKVRILF